MKHIQTFESFVNEANDLSYWTQYSTDNSPQGDKKLSAECKTVSEVVKCIDAAIDWWNKESEEGKLSKDEEKKIGELAMNYFKQFKTINGNIVTAMIAQS